MFLTPNFYLHSNPLVYLSKGLMGHTWRASQRVTSQRNRNETAWLPAPKFWL